MNLKIFYPAKLKIYCIVKNTGVSQKKYPVVRGEVPYAKKALETQIVLILSVVTAPTYFDYKHTTLKKCA